MKQLQTEAEGRDADHLFVLPGILSQLPENQEKKTPHATKMILAPFYRSDF